MAVFACCFGGKTRSGFGLGGGDAMATHCGRPIRDLPVPVHVYMGTMECCMRAEVVEVDPPGEGWDLPRERRRYDDDDDDDK